MERIEEEIQVMVSSLCCPFIEVRFGLVDMEEDLMNNSDWLQNFNCTVAEPSAVVTEGLRGEKRE